MKIKYRPNIYIKVKRKRTIKAHMLVLTNTLFLSELLKSGLDGKK
jgi:hypothetical protein